MATTTTPPESAPPGTAPATRDQAAGRAGAASKPGIARRVWGSTAALREQRYKMIELILFAAGAVLMPFGLLAIGLGWYGTAHSHYDYDQRTYLISGGIMGLGLVLVGGFLYFGAWLARMVTDQRETSRQLSDTLVLLASMASHNGAPAVAVPTEDAGQLVLAGQGRTVHRRDCPLISGRADLHPVSGREPDLTTCRVCHPSLD